MIAEPLFYLFAAIGVLLTGISKSGFASAAGGLSVPLMALFIPAPQAAAIMLPLLLAMDITGLLIFRRRYDPVNLRIILPGAMLGILIGTVTVGHINPRWITGLIGVESVLFALDRFRETRLPRAARPPSKLRGYFWGAISGFTSFISHAGGPPISQYLLPQKMDKVLMVGTTVIFFATVNFAKLPAYAWLGMLDMSNLSISALLLPAVPVGYWIGVKLLHRLNAERFNLTLAWLLLLAGTKLMWDAL